MIAVLAVAAIISGMTATFTQTTDAKGQEDNNEKQFQNLADVSNALAERTYDEETGEYDESSPLYGVAEQIQQHASDKLDGTEGNSENSNGNNDD